MFKKIEHWKKSGFKSTMIYLTKIQISLQKRAKIQVHIFLQYFWLLQNLGVGRTTSLRGLHNYSIRKIIRCLVFDHNEMFNVRIRIK